MDAFYVAVEVRRDPSLRGRPVVVGGTGSRGVVASASYEARAHGVHSAMPSARARRLCPDAVFLPGDHRAYAETSRRIMDVLRSFTPLVEPLSLDEAFLDVAGVHRLHGPGPEVAQSIRARLREQEELDCAVGVSTTKFVAKLASRAAKPRPSLSGPTPGPGVLVVPAGGEVAFLHPLPVTELWGVGPATFRRLEGLGVRTVGDLAELPAETLEIALGSAVGRHLHDLSWGRDDRAVEPDQRPKSIGHEETFAVDPHALDTLGREVVRQADAVAARLRAHGVAARTVTLKVRFGDFRTITRSATLPEAVDSGPALAATAKELLSQVDPTPGVRLVGVSASGLVDGGTRQLTLDESDGSSWGDAEAAVDRVRARFGDESVRPAVLGDGLTKRPDASPWGPGEG